MGILESLKKVPFPNRLFFLLSLIFGLMMVNIVPPLQAPDEVGHFIKAYSFSEFKVRPEAFKEKLGKEESTWGNFGFEVPYTIKSMNSYAVDMNGKKEKFPYFYEGVDKDKIEKGEKAFIGTGGITNYYFVNYIPQIMGIAVGKTLGKPMIWQYYAARYANLFGYILIMFFAIWKFRFSKLGAAVLALNPMALFLASSTSGDAMIISMSFLFISWLTGLIGKERLSNMQLLISALLMITLVLLKPTLIVLGMLFFLIPNRSFSIKRKAVWGIIIFAACILCYVIWNKMMIDQQLLYRDFGNPDKQLAQFLKDPSIFFENVRKNYLFGVKGDSIVYSFVGKFGLLDAPMGLHWIVLYFSSLILGSLVQEKDGQSLIVYQRVLLCVLMALYTLLTFFALYQIWNKVGRTASIEGLQGRYFIPISLVVVPLFSSKEAVLTIKPMKMNIAVSLILVLVLIAAIVTLTGRYPAAM
ncbi:DUF2142 domain-containing protein [Enterococcus gilvus]|uniref:DUF2142 domain-containing protein n=1 Tax=Enterococcus gilvus TaxID=160453 RepID=UPI00211CACA5|nr:DUF2142 domain-containing protein [Enterococcus gilvus]